MKSSLASSRYRSPSPRKIKSLCLASSRAVTTRPSSIDIFKKCQIVSSIAFSISDHEKITRPMSIWCLFEIPGRIYWPGRLWTNGGGFWRGSFFWDCVIKFPNDAETRRSIQRRRGDAAHERGAASRPHHSTKAAKGDCWQDRQSPETGPSKEGQPGQRRSMIRRSRRRCLISRSSRLRLTRLPVRQSLAFCTLDCLCGALNVSDAQCSSLVVAEIEFGQIPL